MDLSQANSILREMVGAKVQKGDTVYYTHGEYVSRPVEVIKVVGKQAVIQVAKGRDLVRLTVPLSTLGRRK